jgi:hypothetical protein
LLDTLVEIQGIAYNSDAQRTPRSVLVKTMSDHNHASSVEKQYAQVSKLASSLPNFPNTVIPKDMLVNHPSSWQAHLERISDFILLGKGVWWDECENGDILFFDAKGSPESLEKGPFLHHFRSSSFK